VGLFGNVGSGNLGNDASFEVALAQLQHEHPNARFNAMCSGPEPVRNRYGIRATSLQAFREQIEVARGIDAWIWKVLAKIVDVIRIAFWVQLQDVIVVPGMGVFEPSLPVRAFAFPYALFLLCGFGRLFQRQVAFVGVGATPVKQRATRSLFTKAAGMATSRSYRDAASLQVMRDRGIFDPRDHVAPDMVFGYPIAHPCAGDPKLVGVGVMAYGGGSDDRGESADISARHLLAMKNFVRWLVDTGHRVWLFGGDAQDFVVMDEVLRDIRSSRPDADPACVEAKFCMTPAELMDEMAAVGTFVGTRYHNVLSALRLSKPTISIGYSSKHDALMAQAGMPEYSVSLQDLDITQLVARFTDLETEAPKCRRALLRRNRKLTREVDEEFAELEARLFPASHARGLSGDPVDPQHVAHAL
jgi:polysaccharide pyruvyl transferase WcaK-like protein